MYFRLCVGYIFTPWEHPDLQKKKQHCTNSVFLFPFKFQHRDCAWASGSDCLHFRQGTNSHMLFLPSPLPASSLPQPRSHFSWEMGKLSACPHASRTICNPSWLSEVGDTCSLLWAGQKAAGRTDSKEPGAVPVLCGEHTYLSVQEDWWEVVSDGAEPRATHGQPAQLRWALKAVKSCTAGEHWQRKGKGSSCHGCSLSGRKNCKVQLCFENDLLLPCFSACERPFFFSAFNKRIPWEAICFLLASGDSLFPESFALLIASG